VATTPSPASSSPRAGRNHSLPPSRVSDGRTSAALRRRIRTCGASRSALAGIPGPSQPFASEAQLAAYTRVTPLEASSAGRVRHRLNRGGNRRLNAILYRIALVQARHAPTARAYLDRRRAEGKTSHEPCSAQTLPHSSGLTPVARVSGHPSDDGGILPARPSRREPRSTTTTTSEAAE
jgi:hypothetical protein